MNFRFLILSIIFISCSVRRKDIDETLNIETITEKRGIYYSVDHEGNMTEYTGTDTTYYNENYNNKTIKATYTLLNGIPNGHWQQFDNYGITTLDIYFDNGKVIKKIKGKSADN